MTIVNRSPIGEGSNRREPTQRRSRERVERILTAATHLIETGGSDAMRMSDVASQAGVSIGSLYQYFPDKGAIIRTLAERFNAEGRACVATELSSVQREADLPAALDRVVEGYYEMFLAAPVMRDIWSGTQADKDLQAMDAADIRAHTDMLLAALTRLRPTTDRESLTTSSFLMMSLTAATVRLAISLDREEGDALIAAFKGVLRRELAPTHDRSRL